MKWIKPDTIIKKSNYLILGAGIIMIAALQIAMPFIFYQIMSSYIANDISNILCTNTISQSYIWRGNTNTYSLDTDEELASALYSYCHSNDSGIKGMLREKILAKLETKRIGQPSHQTAGDGAIVSVSYTMIHTETGESFYKDEAAEAAEVLLDSGWLAEIPAGSEMIYSPVLGDGPLQVICFVVPFSVHGIQCYGIQVIDFAYIYILFQRLENMGIHDFCILQDDRVLYKNTDYTIDFDSYPEFMFEQPQYVTAVLYRKSGMDFMTLVSYEGENMKIAVHADRDVLLEPYRKIILIIEGLMYGIILLLVVLISLFLRQLLKRLTVLKQRIERVTTGNYTPLPEDCHNDEIGSLTQNFNVMVETIQTDIERRVSQEKRESQMQYSLLVSAIDPHFIYNTLNTITFLSHMGKTEEIVKVNTALIGTLKDRLAVKNCKTYDTVMAEKEILAQYMLIQSYLCHNTIDYQFEINEADESLLVPKNILQPLVENSIKHGLLPHKDPETHQILDGKISVHVKREKAYLIINITDNGIGISPEKVEKYFNSPLQEITETEAEHIGIYNIRKRLGYLYGNQYLLQALSPPEGGCSILLQIPVTVG